MADLFPVANSHISIGPAMTLPSADVAVADFTSVSWTEIDGWTNMGKIGDAAALITTSLINRGRDVKQKGTRNAGSMQNQFAINSDDPGQLALIAAEGSNHNYPFKIEFDDAPAIESGTVTMTIAAPGVLTWTANPLAIGDAIKLSTTGALPTGLVAGTTYYVKTKPDADTFTLAATPGGSAITTTGSQSGVHTATTVPTGTLKYFVGLVTDASEAGGAANTVRLMSGTIEINSNVVTVAPTA